MQEPKTGEMETISRDEYKEMQQTKRNALFQVGETVTVNGGNFRIRKITKKDLILRGIPGERKEQPDCDNCRSMVDFKKILEERNRYEERLCINPDGGDKISALEISHKFKDLELSELQKEIKELKLELQQERLEGLEMQDVHDLD